MNRLDVKYDSELDLKSENSLKLIDDRLRDNAKILEFGPANGRFTKHLNINRNCTVDIVEYNAVSGRDAASFARKAFLGEEEGDIEKYIWAEKLMGEKYDFIIFADVLEHLYDPEKVLERCKDFLCKSGCILISVPNIANNNIVLGLLEDEFNYTPTGILDDTHIRFFTYKSIYKMADRLHYGVSNVDYTIGRIGETEININIPENRDVTFAFEHELGNVYQWIFELGLEKKPVVNVKELPIKYIPHAYYSIDDTYYPETMLMHDTLTRNDDIYEVTFNFLGKVENKFRFDPLEGVSCRVKVLEVKTKAGICQMSSSNAMVEKEDVMFFLTKDPIIEFSIDNNDADSVYIRYQILPLTLDVLMKEIVASNDAYNTEKEKMLALDKVYQKTKEELTVVTKKLIKCKNELEKIKSSRIYRLLCKL